MRRLFHTAVLATVAVCAACGTARATGLPSPARLQPVPTVAATTTGGTPQVTASATPAATSTANVPASPTSPATPPATATSAAVTLQQVIDVADATFPRAANGTYGPCDESGGRMDLSPCPVTPRLLARLQALTSTPGGGGGAEPLCRCQNVSTSRAITPEVSAAGGTAHVTLFGGQVHLDLDLVLTGGRLLVDDTRCTGGAASTSIYVSPLALCS